MRYVVNSESGILLAVFLIRVRSESFTRKLIQIRLFLGELKKEEDKEVVTEQRQQTSFKNLNNF